MLNTQKMTELNNLGMTNFDGTIDDGLSDALQAQPGKVFGIHAGWNFNGRVYFNDGKFWEEVWVYGSPVDTISADSLLELMDAVCDRYGND